MRRDLLATLLLLLLLLLLYTAAAAAEQKPGTTWGCTMMAAPAPTIPALLI
jgi:hypothetical protein